MVWVCFFTSGLSYTFSKQLNVIPDHQLYSGLVFSLVQCISKIIKDLQHNI